MLGLMKPDSGGPRPLPELDERAHLHRPDDRSHRIWRYAPSPLLTELVERYWIPVWSLPAGAEAVQRVLQYPVALIVIDAAAARFAGVTSAMSSVTLEGDAYAVGVMFRPSAGALIVGGSMADWTDRTAALGEVLADDADALAIDVRAAMAADPHDPSAHLAALDGVERVLARFVPVDAEGLLVNEIVAWVEASSDVVRVSQLCERFDVGERALQRLTRRRLGITPKWLIRRRRLHEATEALRAGDMGIAEVAARLGYADQAHLTRDLRSVTDLTPAQIACLFGRAAR